MDHQILFSKIFFQKNLECVFVLTCNMILDLIFGLCIFCKLTDAKKKIIRCPCNLLFQYTVKAGRIPYFPLTPKVKIAQRFKTGVPGKTAYPPPPPEDSSSKVSNTMVLTINITAEKKCRTKTRFIPVSPLTKKNIDK